MKQEKDHYSIAEAADALSLGRSYIYTLIKQGHLKAEYGDTVPSPLLIPHKSIIEYLSQRYPVLAANDNFVQAKAENNV